MSIQSDMAGKIVADYRLGSRRKAAREKARRLAKRHPLAVMQFSQHAPEGYDGAYSVTFFARRRAS